MLSSSKIRVGARAVALALAASSFSAHAVLERAGPASVAPSVGGFPSWYQDTTGIAIEFCSPMNQSEADGGWCLVFGSDVPVIPEVFPTNFFDEHFYWSGTALIGTRQAGGKALLVLAEEGAFAVGPVVAGDQITFARIRVRLAPIPVSGSYRFIHPYGEEVIQGVAGDRIFFSDDTGIGAPGDFSGSLRSRMGPWLLPSATPGGTEMPALTAANPEPDTDPAHFGGVFAPTPYPGTGASYIADPARLGPVTGSALPNFIDSTGISRNHNIFRVEGPVGSGLGVDPLTGALVDWIETTDFGVTGRVFTGVLPGRVTVDRASYTRSASAQKLDVFATAIETVQGRVPAAPRPVSVASSLTYFNAPCEGTLDALGTVKPPFRAPAGATETPMKSAGDQHWGQTKPPVIPTAVCVKDASARDAAGNLVAVYVPHVVTDEVTITPAFYDPDAATLTVGARSNDTYFAPTLTLAYGTIMGDLAGGQIVVPGIIAPPFDVFVQSSAAGSIKYQVTTGFIGAAVLPVAVNDAFTMPMNSAPQILAVLANDSNAAGGTVTLTSAPTRGIAAVNTNGSVTYTPSLNLSGTDGFTYKVTVGTKVSNVGLAMLTITPVNLPPTAVNDTASAVLGIPLAINVVGNDTDVNGSADIVAAVNVTQPTPAGASTSVAGGIVTFNATNTGTYSFTYRAADAGGLVSANTATVTVTVAASETVNITTTQYRLDKSRLTVTGSITPAAVKTVKAEFINAAGTVVGLIGNFVSSAAGAWSIDKVLPLPAGTTAVKVTGPNGGVKAVALTLK